MRTVTKITLLIVILLLGGCGVVHKNKTANSSIRYNESMTTLSKNQRMQAASKLNAELGLAYLQRNQLPRAKQKLLQAVKQDPKSPIALDSMAYYWEVIGNNELAEQYYRKAIGKAPNSGRALNNFGAYLCRVGKYKDAEKYLIAAATETSYIETAASFENAGLCALNIPDIPKAIAYFKKALEQEPNRQTSYYELARIYNNQKKYSLAKRYIDGYLSAEQPDASGLWLSIQIAQNLRETVSILKSGAQLERNFPNSKEYKLYQKMQI